MLVGVGQKVFVYFSAHRGLTGGFLRNNISLVLFNNPESSRYFNTLSLLGPHLCFIIGVIVDL